MLEVFHSTLSYAPVVGIHSLRIIVAITYEEGIIIFVLDISNAFQNFILPHPAEIVYLRLPYLYLDCYKREYPKHTLASRNQKELCTQKIKSIQGTKPAGEFWYELLKSIFITVKMIKRSSEHAVLSCVYNNYESFLDVETDYHIYI